jgi:hypothetical protein
MRPREDEGSWQPAIEACWHTDVDALPTPDDTAARFYEVCRIGWSDADADAGAALILIADTRVPPRISRRERRGTGPRLPLPARSGYVARAGHTGSW